MKPEFTGIEKRLEELKERLARLEPLRNKPRSEFDEDPYLRDIVERNFEICAQCCIDICNRIISLEKAKKPQDYYDAFIRMGEIGVLPSKFARHLAPLSGFRNILVHDYLGVNWDEVYRNFTLLDDLYKFSERISSWLRDRTRQENG